LFTIFVVLFVVCNQSKRLCDERLMLRCERSQLQANDQQLLSGGCLRKSSFKPL